MRTGKDSTPLLIYPGLPVNLISSSRSSWLFIGERGTEEYLPTSVVNGSRPAYYDSEEDAVAIMRLAGFCSSRVHHTSR